MKQPELSVPLNQRIERIARVALWCIVIVLLVYVGAFTAIVTAELSEINAVLLAVAANDRGQLPATKGDQPPTSGGMPDNMRVGIAGAATISNTLVMTVSVSVSGSVRDLLYEPPVLQDASGGRTYPITPDSLERARYAFLDLITRSQATARLEFEGAPGRDNLWLTFNPNQQTGHTLYPQVRVPVPK